MLHVESNTNMNMTRMTVGTTHDARVETKV